MPKSDRRKRYILTEKASKAIYKKLDEKNLTLSMTAAMLRMGNDGRGGESLLCMMLGRKQSLGTTLRGKILKLGKLLGIKGKFDYFFEEVKDTDAIQK